MGITSTEFFDFTQRFDFYRREAQNDSSGFEHVFVGEERNVSADCLTYLSLIAAVGSSDWSS